MPDQERFTRKRNRRGSGSVFQKVEGGQWHIQYYAPELDPVAGRVRSKRVREYCTLPKSEAQKLLNDRLAKIGRLRRSAPLPWPNSTPTCIRLLKTTALVRAPWRG